MTPSDAVEHPRTGPLRGHLPALHSGQAEAARALWTKGDTLDVDTGGRHLVIRGDVGVPASAVDFVRLAHADGEILFVQMLGRNEPMIGDLAWQDLAGEARLLAWALSHEPLLAALSEALGQKLLPAAFGHDPTAHDEHLWLGVAFDETERDIRWEGWLGMDAAAVRALAAGEHWRIDEAGAAARRERIALACELRTPPPRLMSAELRTLGPGDVLVLGSRAEVFASLRLVVPGDASQRIESMTWGAKWLDGALTVTHRFDMDAGMSEQQNDEPSQAASDRGNASPLATVPVLVDVIVAAPRLTIGEIERLAPGHLLPLRQPLDHAMVRLRINGSNFANGELVALGDTLGVRIVNIDDSG